MTSRGYFLSFEVLLCLARLFLHNCLKRYVGNGKVSGFPWKCGERRAQEEFALKSFAVFLLPTSSYVPAHTCEVQMSSDYYDQCSASVVLVRNHSKVTA